MSDAVKGSCGEAFPVTDITVIWNNKLFQCPRLAELNSYFLNLSTYFQNIDDDGKQQHKTSTQSSLDKLGEIFSNMGGDL